MKNKHRIELDFTSLLDIIMVILFFFIIFSKLETDDAKNKYEDMKNQVAHQQQELDDLIADAQNKRDEAEAIVSEAKEMLDEAEKAQEHSGNNAEAIIDMIQGKNIKLYLKMGNQKNDWKLRIVKEEEQLSEVSYSSVEEMYKAINLVLENADCQKDKTLIVDFLYDANESGTTSAYSHIHKVFEKLKKEYNHICISETDTSIFSDEAE